MDRPTEGAPGDSELMTLCDNARKIVEVCDALGFEFRGADHFIALMRGGDHHHHTLEELIEDPDLRPYIWDQED